MPEYSSQGEEGCKVKSGVEGWVLRLKMEAWPFGGGLGGGSVDMKESGSS